jgi:hypothetical protein
LNRVLLAENCLSFQNDWQHFAYDLPVNSSLN